MCGIAGLISLDGAGMPSEPLLRRMIAAQRHRGPDDEGYYTAPGVGLGFCRLAVIDPTAAGHQPMPNEDETVWVVFNGEIYNYRELRPSLEQAGHRFRSRCDTEVIVHAYEEWGSECLNRFNGQFAFVIWDLRQRRLFLARDRIGKKSLHIWSDGRSFAFGSELKSLLAVPFIPRPLNRHALQAYFVHEYVPAPDTIFSGINKFPAGHYLEIPLDGSRTGYETGDFRPRSFWNVRFSEPAGRSPSLEESTSELLTRLRAAVARRLNSDVPLGALLSGGIDSSAVVALMAEQMSQPVKTFSIGFDDRTFNELPYARMVAARFQTDHHEEILRPNALELLLTVAGILDEPLADASALPTHLVSRAAREHVIVALAGDGGDDLFAGYEPYQAQAVARLTTDRLPESARRALYAAATRVRPSSAKKGWQNMVRRFLEGAALPAAMEHMRWRMFASASDLDELLSFETDYFVGGLDQRCVSLLAESNGGSRLGRMQYADIKLYLPDDLLVKADRMSMAVSLELRAPFLDYELLEFVAGLPSTFRLKGLTTKVLLRHALRGILPDSILTRPKLGFNIPYKNWLRTEWRELVSDLLSPDALASQGLFQPAYVQRLLQEHLSGQRDHAHKLWPLLMFQLWAERYLHDRVPEPGPGAGRPGVAPKTPIRIPT